MKQPVSWEKLASIVTILGVLGGICLSYGALSSTVSAQGSDITTLQADGKSVVATVSATRQRVEDIADFIGVPKRAENGR